MTQPRAYSFFEALFGTATGFTVTMALQAIIYPIYNIQTSHAQNAQIAGIFTIASIARGYVVRRIFNWWGTL